MRHCTALPLLLLLAGCYPDQPPATTRPPAPAAPRQVAVPAQVAAPWWQINWRDGSPTVVQSATSPANPWRSDYAVSAPFLNGPPPGWYVYAHGGGGLPVQFAVSNGYPAASAFGDTILKIWGAYPRKDLADSAAQRQVMGFPFVLP